MTELKNLDMPEVRASRANKNGLTEYYKVNFPKNWAERKNEEDEGADIERSYQRTESIPLKNINDVRSLIEESGVQLHASHKNTNSDIQLEIYGEKESVASVQLKIQELLQEQINTHQQEETYPTDSYVYA